MKLRYLVVATVVIASFSAVAFGAAGDPTTKLISKTSNGAPAEGGYSEIGVVTPDGRFVAFDSSATNLPGSISPDFQVYIRNRQEGKTQLVSKANNGDPAGGSSSYDASVSASGRYVAFESYATNLPGSLGPSFDQVYVRDRKTGKTKLVSRTSSGSPATGGYSENASISGDGRFVMFQSSATNMPGTVGGTLTQIYVRDLERNKTSLVSKTTGGVPADGFSADPSISRDGRFLGFESASTNLPGGLGTTEDQVYIRSRETGKTALVSKSTAGSPADAESEDIMVSANGRFAGFESEASNLPGGGTERQAYLRDRKKSKTILVSQSSGGVPGSGGESEDASVTDNGRFVAFESEATNLGGLTTGNDQVFIRDRKDGKTRLASTANDGSPANDDSYLPRSSSVLTADGRHVVFYSYGSNLPGSLGPTYLQVYIRGPLP